MKIYIILFILSATAVFLVWQNNGLVITRYNYINNVYKEFNFDLVFSGHAHGGQIRIPLIGGILAPDQGFFPKYSEGIIKEGPTSIVVSRGLGNSIFPFRIFNRPELVVVSLIHE